MINNYYTSRADYGTSQINQDQVKGLEERFDKTEKALHSIINLTFEYGKKIEELNKQNQNRFAEIEHVEYVIIPKIKTLLIALHIMVLGLFIFDLGVVWYIIKH